MYKIGGAKLQGTVNTVQKGRSTRGVLETNYRTYDVRQQRRGNSKDANSIAESVCARSQD